jgi:hypothetical protein
LSVFFSWQRKRRFRPEETLILSGFLATLRSRVRGARSASLRLVFDPPVLLLCDFCSAKNVVTFLPRIESVAFGLFVVCLINAGVAAAAPRSREGASLQSVVVAVVFFFFLLF